MNKEINTKTYLEIFEEMLNEVKVFEVKDTYEAWEIMQYGFLQDLLLFAVEKECMSEMLAIAVEEYIVSFLDEKNPRLDEVIALDEMLWDKLGMTNEYCEALFCKE